MSRCPVGVGGGVHDHARRSGFAPARQGLCRRPHVRLGEVAGAHREELHQLSGVVLIGGLPGRRPEVEVAEHPGVDGHLVEEVPEIAQRVVAPGLVLPIDEGVLEADLAVVAGEVAVPEERHPLCERGRAGEHLVDPPLLERGDLDRSGPAGLICPRKGRRLGRGGLDQARQRLLEAVGLSPLELGRPGAEGRPAEELHHLRVLVAERRDPVRPVAHRLPEGAGLGARVEAEEPDGGDPGSAGDCGAEDGPARDGAPARRARDTAGVGLDCHAPN